MVFSVQSTDSQCVDLKELVHLLPLFVAVTGKAWSSQPLQCTLADQEAVVVEVSKLCKGFISQKQRQQHLQFEYPACCSMKRCSIQK